ncbi:DNA-3-methyladenine glycosylase [Evansella sp. AB-P1]|uniref:DNA-3-methyladenine glycosylase family protein n=1 Tax=Evansella sp. AB-P1 TaxID=3037653 RepID=UPI00241ECE74|nr:DNA-3-methyladenine glycosylase [Evansella sp. AB-P1]MDG5786137.1 DNA-3-methyladenine glycosylase [Evansella sp. AB-P1]
MDRQISVKGPYNFFQALKRLKIDPLNDIDFEKQAIKIPLIINEKPVVVRLQQIGTVEAPIFRIVTFTNIEKAEEAEVFCQLERIFHWDVPLEDVYHYFKETDLGALFERYRGTPFVCDFNLYGSLMKTIIHQQLNMAFAYELSKRFVMNFGQEIDGVWFYPSPETVSKLKVEELRELQFSQRKAEYVIDTSKLIANNQLHLDSMRTLEDEEVIEKLVAIRGIGRWTAECFLMFGLGRMDLFPIQDIGIQNGLKKYFQLNIKPTKEDMLQKSEAWKPYRTYTSLYLWESIETD